MQPVSLSRSRVKVAMRSSSLALRAAEMRCQSSWVAVRSDGSSASTEAISSSEMPQRCAADDRDAPDRGASEAALVAAGPLRADEPELLVEPQRRRRHAGPTGQLPDTNPLS
jgi:hypothetical protein